jgi:hypothetical protein
MPRRLYDRQAFPLPSAERFETWEQYASNSQLRNGGYRGDNDRGKRRGTRMMSLIAIALLAASGPGMSHSVTVPHATGSVRADYNATLKVVRNEIGMSMGTRQGNARCQWEAFAHISRSVEQGAGPERDFAPVPIAKGFRPGGCMETRTGITADVARHHHKVGQVLVETAARDQATLLASLNGKPRLASGD